MQPDIGLPIYRPDIIGLQPEHRGTLLLSHTFSDPDFLPRLLALGRSHRVKLTGLLHAAMLRAVYESSDPKPTGPDDVYNSGSPMDLRNGYLRDEYCERTRYVNIAVAIQPMRVPCRLFQSTEGAGGEGEGEGERRDEGLWRAAACVAEQWDEVRKGKGLVGKAERHAQELVEMIVHRR